LIADIDSLKGRSSQNLPTGAGSPARVLGRLGRLGPAHAMRGRLG
jgi:hypothetical protein